MNNNELPFEIYVINLDKDADRLEKMRKRLEPNEFKRIKGIYGNEYDFSNDDAVYFTCKYFCPKSVIGCALSHRLALKTFLETSEKEYLLLFEDDAEPIYKDYIKKTEESIKNAPTNWDVIKLDWGDSIFRPLNKYFEKDYLNYYSALTTALVINKKGAKKILQNKIYWHYDNDLYFYELKIYNSPDKIFKQTWDEENNSNNRNKSMYPNGTVFLESLNFKVVRIGDNEFSWNDLIYFLLFLILLFLLNRYYPIDFVIERFKTVLSITKTK
jgi:GR25 family glycosyltransferase involved in LPS biosynthesis